VTTATRRASGPLRHLTYVLPLKSPTPVDGDLSSYLAWLSSLLDVIVVDGSEPAVFAANHARWGERVRHVPVGSTALNGKVAGVCDGVAAADKRWVIVADDDVRYDREALDAVADLLESFDVVVPQNYFSPDCWHTRWDTARSLVNRAWQSDFAGTIAVRRAAFLVTRGYCGAVLFENLELIRTLAAHGFDVHHAREIFVARRPPSLRHFYGQRVRQAYDSFAQPGRMAAELAVLPLLVAGTIRTRAAMPVAAGVAIMMAERGRRRDGGRTVYPWSRALYAPLWVAERAVCSWLAVGCFLRGGVRYSGGRLRTAAHRQSQVTTSSCPEDSCTCDLVLRRGGLHRLEVAG
jgi:hypothetical protein